MHREDANWIISVDLIFKGWLIVWFVLGAASIIYAGVQAWRYFKRK